MSQTTTAKRTAGRLAAQAKHEATKRLDITPRDRAKLVACWNAVESIGGDPENVARLAEALAWIVTFLDEHGEVPFEPQWMDDARAALAACKVKA
jgi:hypothetical protein